MRQAEYRSFDTELSFLSSLPGVEVHMHPYFIELPLLALVFKQLSSWERFSDYRWLIFSRQHQREQVKTELDEKTVLFYMSNEDGTLPEFYPEVGHVFTPDLNRWPAPENVRMIPLGCNGDVPEAPWIPMQARTLDVFFSGQVLPQRSPFIMQAIQLLYDLQPHLELQAQIQLTPRFRSGLSPEQYSQTLMNSKICLIPPGISPITLRLFEAMRAGCMLITHELPPFWYLQGLPRIEMPSDWVGLSETVLSLLSQPERMLEVQARIQQHYLAHCTPSAVARYVRQELSQRFA